MRGHYKKVKTSDAILAIKHFQEKKHAQVIIIDQFTNKTNSKYISCQKLIKKENVWIKTL